MEEINIPDSWENVDLIKQTEGLMVCVCVCVQVCVYKGCPVECKLLHFVNLHIQCTTASLPLTEELLFVRKAQAIVNFCLECWNLLKTFKLDISLPEGARCYLAERDCHLNLLFICISLAIPICYVNLHSTPTTDNTTGFNPPTPPGAPSRKQFAFHVPSEATLGFPIRCYISETLICHVLGQPSHSLACCLISAITDYLGIPLPKKQMPMEDVCKLVGRTCLNREAVSKLMIQGRRKQFLKKWSSYDLPAWPDHFL